MYFHREERGELAQKIILAWLKFLCYLLPATQALQFLSVLLSAPSVFDGISCPRGIEAGNAMTDCFRRIGGGNLLGSLEMRGIIEGADAQRRRQPVMWKAAVELAGTEYIRRNLPKGFLSDLTEGTIWEKLRSFAARRIFQFIHTTKQPRCSESCGATL